MQRILIANITKDTFGIGYDGKLLVSHPFDLKRFANITKNGNNAILMGFNTFKSIGKKLPERLNIVITKEHLNDIPQEQDLISVDSLEKGEQYAIDQNCDNLFIIGGESIYRQYIENGNYNHMELTISSGYKGPIDTFFPRFDEKMHRIQEIDVHENLKFIRVSKIENLQEEAYIDLLKEILENGETRQTRNSETISLFGKSLSFDLRKGFPLLTTKKVWFKGVAEELLWFLKGDTNVEHLQEKKVKIWNGNTNREYLDSISLKHYTVGDAGPIYGFQWRHWNAKYKGCCENYDRTGIDQLAQCIQLLNENPNSRRILMSGWNPEQLPQMSLPPCHVLYQFYLMDGQYLCCQMYQRSSDVFLGLPFNIASTALLTTIMSHYCGFKPGTIRICIGDVHVYKDHVNVVKEQIERRGYSFPTFSIKGERPEKIENYEYSQFLIEDYKFHPKLTASMVI